MPDKKIVSDIIIQICPVCKEDYKFCPHTLRDALKEFTKPNNTWCSHLSLNDGDYLCNNPEELNSSNCKDDKCSAKTQKTPENNPLTKDYEKPKDSDGHSIWHDYKEENKQLHKEIEELKLENKAHQITVNTQDEEIIRLKDLIKRFMKAQGKPVRSWMLGNPELMNELNKEVEKP